MAYDHVDKWGNVTSKVFVNAMEKEEQDVRQVLILPSNELDPLAVQDPLAEPDLQTLKAVPISGSFPPMFIMQNDIDNFKAANNGVTSFQIMTEMLKSDAPLENQWFDCHSIMPKVEIIINMCALWCRYSAVLVLMLIYF